MNQNDFIYLNWWNHKKKPKIPVALLFIFRADSEQIKQIAFSLLE